MIGLHAALLLEYCHCCGEGCDCGCINDCRVLSHRRAAGIPDDQKPGDPS